MFVQDTPKALKVSNSSGAYFNAFRNADTAL